MCEDDGMVWRWGVVCGGGEWCVGLGVVCEDDGMVCGGGSAWCVKGMGCFICKF